MAQTKELVDSLEQVGLTEKEAEVYLALLSSGSATAYRIAEKCGVKKPTVYVTLEELRKKGLVLKIPHAKKALFSAVDISEYVREQETKLKAVRDLAPKLNSLASVKDSSVYFFTGIRGIEQALAYKFDSMKGKTFYCFYGSMLGVEDVDEIARMYEKWNTKALNADISFQIIMPRKGAEKYNKQLVDLSKSNESVQVRFLDQYEYPPNASIGIGENFLWILDEKHRQATVIDNASTADAMRQIFKIVWQKGV